MKSFNLKKLLLLLALGLAVWYLVVVLRVYRLRRLPRTANRRPVNKTAPVHRTADFAKLHRILQLDLSTKSQSDLESIYFQLVKQQHLECPFYWRIGDAAEGGWDVCFTSPFDIRQSKQQCFALSFGVDDIFAYDDELADKFGCRVHTFDPSMTNVASHKRRPTSWFHQTGLSSNNSVLPNGWRMRTLCSLVDELVPSGASIDIVKLDVEHWEWASLETALRDGCLVRVKQLMFESHTSELLRVSSDYARLVHVFLGLFRLGFRSWRSDENPMSAFYYSRHTGVYRACCYEHYMLNTRFITSRLP